MWRKLELFSGLLSCMRAFAGFGGGIDGTSPESTLSGGGRGKEPGSNLASGTLATEYLSCMDHSPDLPPDRARVVTLGLPSFRGRCPAGVAERVWKKSLTRGLRADAQSKRRYTKRTRRPVREVC